MSKQCIQNLKPVITITAIYMRTGRPKPTTPSHFMLNALNPIQDCISNIQKLTQKQTSEWKFQTVSKVFRDFEQLVVEANSNITKAEKFS